MLYMARRKITQAMADQIKMRYEAISAGLSHEIIEDIQNDFGISRTSVFALRDKDWNIMAPRPGSARSETSGMVESLKALRTRVELLEDELRSLRNQVETIKRV